MLPTAMRVDHWFIQSHFTMCAPDVITICSGPYPSLTQSMCSGEVSHCRLDLRIQIEIIVFIYLSRKLCESQTDLATPLLSQLLEETRPE